MRVALVTEFYFPHLGGVTEHVHNLARVLARSGHHAIIITSQMGPSPDYDPAGIEDPVCVFRIGTSRVVYSAGSFARVTTGVGLRRSIRDILRRERIDVVHVHGGLNPVLGLAHREPPRISICRWWRPFTPGSAGRPCAGPSGGIFSDDWTAMPPRSR